MGTVVTSDFLDATFKSFRALYNKTFNEFVPDFERLVQRITSATKSESYTIPGSPPAVTEWKDEREISGLITASFELRNKKYQAAIAVDGDALADEQLGIIRPQIEGMAISMKRHPGKLVHQLIKNGATSTCWDNQYFFDTDHVFGQSGAQSNKLTGTGAALANLKTDWSTVRKAFLTLKDDRGEEMGLVPDLVVCPPDLEAAFRELFNATMISSTTNVLVGQADVMVSPYLTDANDWYAFVTKMPYKPFVYQVREEPVFTQLADPNSRDVFMKDKYYYGARARYNAGYGLWQLACMVANA